MPGRLILPHPRSGGPFLIAAHRGDPVHCPENSLAGFRRAIDEGADLLETDLRPTSDGSFVCFHDSTMDRTSDGVGIVERCHLRDLASRHLRFGQNVWKEEHIPSLEEVAELCPPDVYLALELKSRQFAQQGVCSELLRMLEKLGLRKRIILLSVHQSHLKAMASVTPDIPAGIVSFRPWPHGTFDLLGPVVAVLRLNRGYVREAHRRGQSVCPLDAKPEPRLPFYRDLGIDAVLTDDPGKTVRAALRLG